MDFASIGLPALLAVFAAATLAVAVAGTRITRLADRLADETGLGEAMTGALLLGIATSLAGTVVSVSAAFDGLASLAYANAVGGITAQTAFLAIADLVYRRANLEHASAELANILQSALLCLLLALPLVAATGPDVTVLGVHPVSLALPVIWILGARAGSQARERPMWRPVGTPETREDVPEADAGGGSMPGMLLRFAALAAILALAGWTISRTGARISEITGLSATAVGALMTAVSTSLPELVTTLAAVRRGAVQLAVGGIIGGNTFDVLFLTLSDVAYREGSLHHAIERSDLFWLAVALVSTTVLLLGLIVRERRGLGGIGFESAAVLAIWLGAAVVQVWLG
ncbi:MAG: sodium:calcium antiporter [Paracoccaceae bacterium]